MNDPELKHLVSAVMEDAYLATVATNDADGPWAAPVIFVADEQFNIYWLSKAGRRHSEAIAMYKKASAAIVASWQEDAERAIQMEGDAGRIDVPDISIVMAYCKKMGKPEPQSPSDVIRDDLEWYHLAPSRLELLHTEKFGWDRQRVI